MSVTHRQKSHCRIKVYGFGDKVEGYGTERVAKNRGTAFDLFQDIKTCNISKDINNPANGWNFTLLPRLNWRDGEKDKDSHGVFKIIKPGDWVRIFFSDGRTFQDDVVYGSERALRPKTNMKGLDVELYDGYIERMMGIVDRIAKVKVTLPSGAVQVRYLVSGRCMGKALLETDIYFNPYVEGRANVAGSLLYLRGMVITGSPTEICHSIMNALMCDMAQYSIPLIMLDDIDPDPDTKKLRNLADASERLKKMQDIGKKDGFSVRDQNKFKRKPNSQAFDKFLWRDFKKTDGWTLNASLLEPKGGLWQVLKQFSNPILNEIYVDLLPWRREYSAKGPIDRIESGGILRPTIVLREKPYTLQSSVFGGAPITQSLVSGITKAGLFNGNPLLALDSVQSAIKQREDYVNFFEEIEPVTILKEEEILNEDIGVSEHQRLNWFYITGMMPNNTTNQRASFPKAFVDNHSIVRYGLRRMEQESLYAMYDDPKNISDLKDRLLKWNLTVQHWYENNHRLLNGSITSHALLGLTIGSKLIVKRKKDSKHNKLSILANKLGLENYIEEHYYVEGINDEWEYLQPLKTTVFLTRGMIKSAKSGKLVFHHEDPDRLLAVDDIMKKSPITMGSGSFGSLSA